jgi:hypothetical protein
MKKPRYYYITADNPTEKVKLKKTDVCDIICKNLIELVPPPAIILSVLVIN